MKSQNRMPLMEALKGHISKDPVSFHVPGHKNGQMSGGEAGGFLRYDVTELTGLDDLHAPSEAISEAQSLLAGHYRTLKSYFLVNGSTVGNLAMILGVCSEGDIVLVQRNCHKSILNGLKLANVHPVFLHPEFDEGTASATGISQATLEEALERYPEVKALILTYPTYYGMVYDLEALIQKAKSKGVQVLIDEAHGAHLSVGAPFPKSALELGADIVVQSAHKTLPAMTMGSFLHINNEGVPTSKIEQYLGMLQSSSPSYPIMMSLDYARYYSATYTKEDLIFFQDCRKEFIGNLKSEGYEVIKGDDPLKLSIRLDGLTGFELQEKLEAEGIYPELADPYQVLFILPLIKEGGNFPFNKAIERMSKINAGKRDGKINDINHYIRQDKITELRFSFKEMENRGKRWIPIGEAAGCAAAEVLTPYPPGIPLFYQGEEITEESIEELNRLFAHGAKFQGIHRLAEGKISVFR